MSRAKLVTVIITIVCILISGVPIQLLANTLDSRETILKQRDLKNGDQELFTMKNGEYFKKTAKWESGSWSVYKSNKLILPKTGLKRKAETVTKDKQLAQDIQQKLEATGYVLDVLPSSYDLSTSSYLPPVGDQQMNDCVAWSTGYYIRTFQEAKDLKWTLLKVGLPDNSHVFSPSFIYNQINNGLDKGAYLDDSGNLLKAIGADTLADFPYIPGDYRTQPNVDQMNAAYPHRIRNWRVLFTKNDNSEYMVQQTKQYLLTGDLPVIGINVGFNFIDPINYNGNSIISMDYSDLGGHAITVVGYDNTIDTPDGKGAFKVINSWGTGWGDEGFGYITYPQFINSVQESYVFTDLVTSTLVGSISNVAAQAISPTQIHYSWNVPVNALYYKIFDQASQEIAIVYTNAYTEDLVQPGIYTRSVQAFNSTSASNSFTVTVNTNSETSEQLPVNIQNAVNFTVDFNRSGSYNLMIKDHSGGEVYNAKNLYTSGGATPVQWTGEDLNGNTAPDGQYQFNLTTVNNGIEQTIYDGTFQKKVRVSNTTAEVNRLNGVIQSITVHLTPSTDGKVSVSIKNDSVTTTILTNQTIKASQPVDYTIAKELFDFNNVDLSKVSIELIAQ